MRSDAMRFFPALLTSALRLLGVLVNVKQIDFLGRIKRLWPTICFRGDNKLRWYGFPQQSAVSCHNPICFKEGAKWARIAGLE
jgi:hypothetical protein